MKKNVLQIISSFHQGGSERQAVQLSRLLRDSGEHRIHLAALDGEGVLRKEAESAGFDFIPEFRLNSFYDLNFVRKLRECVRFIKKNEIDIVHTHDFYTNVFGITAAGIAGVPLKIASKRETSSMRSTAQKHVEKQIFRFADRIVVNSEAVREYLVRENIDSDKLQVIYNGLDLHRLTPKISDRKTICGALGLPSNDSAKFITLVANLRHEAKNHPMFLRAAKKLARDFPNAHFVLAGEGGLRESLEQTARDFGIDKNTHFTGRCEMVPELLSISYACVLTSFAEGFSNSILEYMAAGKPVVATDVGGAREAVAENESGFLIASDDGEALADRLALLLKDPAKAETFGRRGRRLVEERFSTAEQLKRTLEMYDRLG